jgi:hypothetical protein
MQFIFILIVIFIFINLNDFNVVMCQSSQTRAMCDSGDLQGFFPDGATAGCWCYNDGKWDCVSMVEKVVGAPTSIEQLRYNASSKSVLLADQHRGCRVNTDTSSNNGRYALIGENTDWCDALKGFCRPMPNAPNSGQQCCSLATCATCDNSFFHCTTCSVDYTFDATTGLCVSKSSSLPSSSSQHASTTPTFSNTPLATTIEPQQQSSTLSDNNNNNNNNSNEQSTTSAITGSLIGGLPVLTVAAIIVGSAACLCALLICIAVVLHFMPNNDDDDSDSDSDIEYAGGRKRTMEARTPPPPREVQSNVVRVANASYEEEPSNLYPSKRPDFNNNDNNDNGNDDDDGDDDNKKHRYTIIDPRITTYDEPEWVDENNSDRRYDRVEPLIDTPPTPMPQTVVQINNNNNNDKKKIDAKRRRATTTNAHRCTVCKNVYPSVTDLRIHTEKVLFFSCVCFFVIRCFCNWFVCCSATSE